jgi:hypothetical protein
MLAAVIAVHVGRVRSKKGDRHRRAARWTIAAVVLLVAGMPWPFLSHGRPLLRLAGPAAQSVGRPQSTGSS